MNYPTIITNHKKRTKNPEFLKLLEDLKTLPDGKSLLFPIPERRVRADTLMVQIRQFAKKHGFKLKLSLHRPDSNPPKEIEISITQHPTSST